MSKYSSLQNEINRKIIIFTTEKNILVDSSYMNVLESIGEDNNVILFKKTLYEESNKKFKESLNNSEKILFLSVYLHMYLVNKYLVYFIKLDVNQMNLFY